MTLAKLDVPSRRRRRKAPVETQTWESMDWVQGPVQSSLIGQFRSLLVGMSTAVYKCWNAASLDRIYPHTYGVELQRELVLTLWAKEVTREIWEKPLLVSRVAALSRHVALGQRDPQIVSDYVSNEACLDVFSSEDQFLRSYYSQLAAPVVFVNIPQFYDELDDVEEVLGTFSGYVDSVEGNKAYLVINNLESETLFGEYSASELRASGIGERTAFTCKVTARGNEIRFEFEPVSGLSDEDAREIWKEVGEAYENFPEDL